ncbi:MAG: hypothetical protein FWD69_08870 [Polyangiaceae bacterium]|nr:hypothetical protein [Polyangiaceae bacterium]
MNGVSSEHTSLVQFTIPAGNFNDGENTITFFVYNGDPGKPDANPTGLLVSDITATGGCKIDDDCAGGTCNVDTGICTMDAQLDNGLGPCAADTAAADCKSHVCDADNLCGYASGGSCTADTAKTVCRSGMCNADGKCLTNEQCLDDTQCNADTQWCDTTTNTCTAKLDNGQDLPGQNTDCTDETGARFCKTGVCDTTDRACGLLDDSPCGNASQCRTADDTCADDGTGQMVCTPPPPCKSDEECAATGQYCNLDTGKCANKIANGNPMPNGRTCPDDVVVCATATCGEKDNTCGVPDGNACTQDSECRSPSTCTNGVCTAPVTPECTSDDGCTDSAAPKCNLETQKCEAAADAGADAGTDASVTDNSPLNVQGNGVLSCAVRAGTPGAAGAGSATFGLGAIALVGLLRRRRNQAS